MPSIRPESGDLSVSLLQFLEEYARQKIDGNAPLSLQFAARDEQGTLLGGITGRVSHGILSVQLLALASSERRAGLGAQLLQTLEIAAVGQGATVARVDTLEFEAPIFYQKQGYEIFGIIGDHTGRRQFFLSKKLGAVQENPQSV